MERVISEIITKLFDQNVSVQLTRPDPKFGDFATNVALQLAKPLGKNPREIAEAIAEELRGRQEFSEVSVAGPGFINVTLSDQAVLESLKVRP
ncbi:MAG: arginine--tRNA ligase, partial [Candidatus Saccharimonas sp.]